jgi:membrane protein DedA with SNARE-associated domain
MIVETTLTALIIKYKYLILFPLGIIEGHLISLLAGVLAHNEYLNPFLAGLVIGLGNLFGDLILYILGYYKGIPFIKKYGNYFGIKEESLDKVNILFHKHKNYVLFLSKITNGFGLAMAILFTAGAVKIPFRIYLFWNILGETIWTGLLISLGYFLSDLYGNVSSGLSKVFLITGTLVILIFVFIKIRNVIIKKIYV